MKAKIWSMILMCCGLLSHAAVFKVPESLKDNVAFWTNIYTSYDSHQVVFFDENDPTLIYDVLDLPRVHGEISGPKYRDLVKKRYQEIERVLSSLGNGFNSKLLRKFQNGFASSLVVSRPFSQEHYKKIFRGSRGLRSEFTLATPKYQEISRIFLKFPDEEKSLVQAGLAKKIMLLLSSRGLLGKDDLNTSLRCQNGLKSQFALGLKLSGRYVGEMKAMLKSQALPQELVALVFVESLFFLAATSHAGASGPWGIVKETGQRLGLHVNNFADERLDPAIATWVAAQFLNKAKTGLEEWPLAITAYNYGYAGMLRATEALNTKDIEVIIANHDSPIFKFASKNYYSEFVAALHVFVNNQVYFPHVKPDPPWRYELVKIEKPVFARDLIRVGAISLEELADLNPSLSKRTLNGDEVLPREYTLRVPPGKGKMFLEKLGQLKSNHHTKAAEKVSFKYRANGREKLSQIAKKLGIWPEFIAKKLRETLDYRPTGTLLIRSEAHRYSQLADMHKYIKAGSPTTKLAKEAKREKAAKADITSLKPEE